MSTSFLPRSDQALLAWSLNFSTRITATPTAYGLTAAQATSYSTAHSSFASALAECDPDERNKIAVANKNNSRTGLKTLARQLALIVQGTGSVTDGQKLELGLTVRQQPSPIPPPADPPALDIVSVIGHTVRIRLHDSTDASRRGRPPGVYGATVFSYVGAEAPTDPAEWKFEGNTGQTLTSVEFPLTLAAGTRVWLTAFWFNQRKESGPGCPPVNTNIQYANVAAA